jgi:hypothetical protein
MERDYKSPLNGELAGWAQINEELGMRNEGTGRGRGKGKIA